MVHTAMTKTSEDTIGAVTRAALRTLLYIVLGAAPLLLIPAIEARAAIGTLTLSVDTDDVGSYFPGPGVSFFPDITIDHEDADMLSLEIDRTGLANADPTLPFTLRFSIEADDEVLSDDLSIRVHAVRATYVDTVSLTNDSATGRLFIYPFYQLNEPEAAIDLGSGIVSWNKVDYAGRYEIVINYIDSGGRLRTAHLKTADTRKDISSYIRASSGGELGVAVRALSTEDIGYLNANVDYASGTASWDSIDGAERYKLRITYTNSSGNKVVKTTDAEGNETYVGSYIRASADGTIECLVRGATSTNDSAYYNIAPSGFALADGSSISVDTDPYEADDVWALLGDYEAVADTSFASISSSGSAGGSSSGGLISGGSAAYTLSAGSPAGYGIFKRNGYRWQFLIDSSPYADGWLLINSYWYYFDADGYMHTGWLDLGGRSYYLADKVGDDYGRMYVGTHRINGTDYYFDESGALAG